MTVRYTQNLAEIPSPKALRGFFEGWPDAPSPETHLAILQNSHAVWLALDGSAENRCAGFITAISDGILCAQIPLLEVLPEYRNRGIGTALLQRMLKTLDHLYAVDLTCDDALAAFYTRVNLRPARAMILRNYMRQSGR